MKNKIFSNLQQFFSSLTSRSNPTKLLYLVIVSSIPIFIGCKKLDSLTSTTVIESQEVKADPITVEMAQKWFESQFGKSHTILPQNTRSNFGSPTDYSDFYFNETYQIMPVWSESEISSYLNTHSILITPIQPISFLDGHDLTNQYALIFFRDADNQINVRLQVYCAFNIYKQAHPIFDVANFSGIFFQIHMTGKVDRILGIENGSFKDSIALAPASICTSENTLFDLEKCLVHDIMGMGIASPRAPQDGNNGISWSFWKDLLGFAGGSTGGGGSSGGGSSSGGGGGGSSTLGGSINNTLFTSTQILARLNNMGFTQYQISTITDNRQLLAKIGAYLSKRDRNYQGNDAAIKNNISIAEADPDLMIDYLSELTNDDEVFNTNKNIGFLKVGSEAWERALTDPILIARYLYVEYITECASLKKSNPGWNNNKIRWQALKNTLIDATHFGLDICGLFPVIGEPCDVANGVFYTIQGDALNATFSFGSAIPFIGWASTGSKYALKVIGISGRTYKLSYTVVNNLIEFGNKDALRSQLRRILNTRGTDVAHHIIPLELAMDGDLAKEATALIQKAANFKAAFHPNEFNNGINIASNLHAGSHPSYTARVKQRLEEIYRSNGGTNISPQIAHQKIQDLLADIRNAIHNQSNLNINDVVF